MPFEDLEIWIISLALALPRIASAFLIIPLLTKDSMPSLVRNSLFINLAIVVFPIVVSSADINSLEPIDLPFIVLKEIFIGATLGFLFGAIFWAIGIAGGIIDTQTGSNMANALDPIQGHQTSLTSQWLSRFAALLFMTSGGFLIFLDVLYSSYRLWPIHLYLPELKLAGSLVFINELSYIMTMALLFSAPAMLLLALVDLAFGIINRFAQQVNVLSLSMPIKAWIGTWVMMLCLGIIVELVLRKLVENREIIERLIYLF